MIQENQDIRAAAKAAGVPIWKIAEAMNCSEPTMTRRFRREMDPEEKERILSIIERLKERNA